MLRRGTLSAVVTLLMVGAGLSGCGDGMDDAVSEGCAADLDWSDKSTGSASLVLLSDIAQKHTDDDDTLALLAKMSEECPTQLDGYETWTKIMAVASNSGSAPAPEPSREPVEQDCGRLGGWVADQQGQGAFTPDEYDSWLKIVDQCFEDQGR